jgi:hypothetical protein
VLVHELLSTCSAPRLHHICTFTALPLILLCTISSPALHHLCTTSALPLLYLCKCSAPLHLLHSMCSITL